MEKFKRQTGRVSRSQKILSDVKAAVKKKYTLKGKQLTLVNDTLDKANANEQVLMLIYGKWGTGKTRTTNGLLFGLKSIGIDSVCTASTGVAACNYEGGMTTQSFGLPVDD